MQHLKDYYQVLGVPTNADAPEIKKAYRALARQYHPDAKNGQGKDGSKFIEATEAYRVLINPERRARYDYEIHTRWRVLAHSNAPHATPAVNAEHLKPFMWILLVFVAFSIFMLVVFVVLLVRYDPDKVSSQDIGRVEAASQVERHTCEFDFVARTSTCNRLEEISMPVEAQLDNVVMALDLSAANIDTVRLTLTLSDDAAEANWVLHVRQGRQEDSQRRAEIQLREGRLLIFGQESEIPLADIADFMASSDTISIEIRDGYVSWRSDGDRGTLDSPALFRLREGEMLWISLNRGLDVTQESVAGMAIVSAVLSVQSN